jgi:hypothetical protein
MTKPINRRTFLALGLGAVAWACGRGKTPGAEPSGPGDVAISILPTAPQGLVVGDSRQAFAIIRGQKPISPKNVRARLVPPGGEPINTEVTHTQIERGPGGGDDHEHVEGTEVTDIWVVTHDFDKTGAWDLQVIFDGGAGEAAFAIADEAEAPTVGGQATASASPTEEDAGGVDPICTRKPACSLHELTIADALAQSKPTVIIFGTPAFCESRTCGPVVDFVEAAAKKYGDDASFIHVEVWKDDEKAVGDFGKGYVPAFAEWKLQTEPWLYFVGSDGVVKDRWLGAAGEDEIDRAVRDLVKG